MKRLPMLAALPLLAATAACGESGQTVTLTNTGNVVPHEAQANYAFRGDGEMTNEMAMENAGMPANDAAAIPGNAQ